VSDHIPEYRPDAGEPTLWRPNPLRRRVPLAGGERQEALLHARRRTGLRRAKGSLVESNRSVGSVFALHRRHGLLRIICGDSLAVASIHQQVSSVRLTGFRQYFAT